MTPKEKTDEEKQAKHDAVYATPYLPPFEHCLVMGRIWAGRNPLTALDIDELAGEGVTHILDLRETKEWTLPGRHGADALTDAEERGIIQKSLPVRDTCEPTPEDFHAAYAFLAEALADENAQVYVHCRAGMERTGAILVAYVARSQNIPFEDASKIIRTGRSIVKLRPAQEAAARRWLAAND